MARRDRNGQGKKDQLDAYKKDIGKQYMDGLISEKEYETMLREKEAELGLANPAPVPSMNAGRKECPSCGALVGDYDAACNICGGALQPSLDKVLVESGELEQHMSAEGSIPRNWRTEWVDKPYRHLPPYELLKMPIDVLKGVSEGDAKRMAAAFNIRTLEDFAELDYLAWAREFASMKGNPEAFSRGDYAHMLVKDYEDVALDDVLAAPTNALQGVSEKDAVRLLESFNVGTVEELGNLNFITWALGIYSLAWMAANEQIPENWRDEWLDKTNRDMTAADLLKQSPEVLKGLSPGDAKRLKDAFNIATLEDFATLKYLSWARELAMLRNDPDAFRNEDFREKLVREYENKSLDEILAAPASALQGVSEKDAALLDKSFKVKTVEELGNLKFVAWAHGILEIAQRPRVFKVGDRVRLPGGDVGTVTFASKPDPKGLQTVEVGVG